MALSDRVEFGYYQFLKGGPASWPATNRNIAFTLRVTRHIEITQSHDACQRGSADIEERQAWPNRLSESERPARAVMD
ncbi:MAG: hypothetical protein ACXWKQ_20345 [Reyranella sp.]